MFLSITLKKLKIIELYTAYVFKENTHRNFVEEFGAKIVRKCLQEEL